MICQNCGRQLDDNAKFCDSCGKHVEIQSERFCPQCGNKLMKDSIFCAKCGMKYPEGNEIEKSKGDNRKFTKAPLILGIVLCTIMIVSVAVALIALSTGGKGKNTNRGENENVIGINDTISNDVKENVKLPGTPGKADITYTKGETQAVTLELPDIETWSEGKISCKSKIHSNDGTWAITYSLDKESDAQSILNEYMNLLAVYGFTTTGAVGFTDYYWNEFIGDEYAWAYTYTGDADISKGACDGDKIIYAGAYCGACDLEIRECTVYDTDIYITIPDEIRFVDTGERISGQNVEKKNIPKMEPSESKISLDISYIKDGTGGCLFTINGWGQKEDNSLNIFLRYDHYSKGDTFSLEDVIQHSKEVNYPCSVSVYSEAFGNVSPEKNIKLLKDFDSEVLIITDSNVAIQFNLEIDDGEYNYKIIGTAVSPTTDVNKVDETDSTINPKDNTGNDTGNTISKVCIHCSGTGKSSFSCAVCHNTGQMKCYSCGGHGKVSCTVCHGTGSYSNYGERSTCISCSGTGKISCSICYGVGSRSCTACPGTGANGLCAYCAGTGKKLY